MNKSLNLPFVQMPDYYTRLLVANIQNNTATNTNLEMYFADHPHLSALIKKIFKDIDAEGFIGKILLINGFTGIRNRLASAFIEHASTGIFPEQVNQNLIKEALQLEHNWRHFTPQGFSRGFLLGFYLKMASVSNRISANLIQDRHLEYMKLSQGKSQRIDWLMLSVLHFDYFLGPERYMSCIKAQMNFDAIYATLSEEEKRVMCLNMLAYGSSIGDMSFFNSMVEHV